MRALEPEPAIPTPAQADWIGRLTEIDRAAVAELRRLEPPAGDEEEIDAMLAAFDRGLGYGREIARASRAGDEAAFRRAVGAGLDELAGAQGRAAGYGVDECARLGRVAGR